MEDLDLFQTYGDLEKELSILKKKVKQEAKHPYKNEKREEELRKERDELMRKYVDAQNKFSQEYEQFLILKTISDFDTSFEQLKQAMALLEERNSNPKVVNFSERKPRRPSFLNTLKNKVGRMRSRSIGGKRTRRGT